MPTLASIHLYPIKSTAGMPLERARVTQEGLAGDRRYMVVKPDGTFITARTHPQLQQVVATPVEGGLQLRYPGLPPLALMEAAFSRAPQHTGVWGDRFTALHTGPDADEWLSRVAREPVRLLWLGEASDRFREKTGTRVSFADGYPLLLISQASLEDLNLRSDALHQMSQFRTNLVASGTRPFEEDGWKRIRIGEVEFRVDKPCSRCIMTTVEAGTERFNALKEPLATLTRYRRGEDGEVYFGQNLVALNEGWIEAGSEIEVLERPGRRSTQRGPEKAGAGVRRPGTPGPGSGNLLVRGRRRRAPARLPAWPAPAHQPRYQKHTGSTPLHPELHAGAARALQHQRQEAGRWPPLPLAAP